MPLGGQNICAHLALSEKREESLASVKSDALFLHYYSVIGITRDSPLNGLGEFSQLVGQNIVLRIVDGTRDNRDRIINQCLL